MSMISLSRTRIGRVALAAAAVLALGIAAADARPGGGSSFGSRGGRTFSAPPATSTAPRTAAPIERSITQPGPMQQQPGFGQRTPQTQPGMFSRPGFGTGFIGGLLGAGLLGMLFGHGLGGGLGGLASLFGLLLQGALIVGLVMLALRFFRSRQQPAYAGAAAGAGPGPVQRMGLGDGAPGAAPRTALGGLLGGGAAATAATAAKPSDAVGIEAADFDAFEARLQAVNAAWDKEDLGALRAVATPEMVGYFGEELAQNAGRGLVDRVSDVHLEQGDLAEAWREGTTDYATVAMRFTLKNALVERATGRVVEGSLTEPQEATELWTFRRERGGAWMLSAIQQA